MCLIKGEPCSCPNRKYLAVVTAVIVFNVICNLCSTKRQQKKLAPVAGSWIRLVARPLWKLGGGVKLHFKSRSANLPLLHSELDTTSSPTPSSYRMRIQLVHPLRNVDLNWNVNSRNSNSMPMTLTTAQWVCFDFYFMLFSLINCSYINCLFSQGNCPFHIYGVLNFTRVE